MFKKVTQLLCLSTLIIVLTSGCSYLAWEDPSNGTGDVRLIQPIPVEQVQPYYDLADLYFTALKDQLEPDVVTAVNDFLVDFKAEIDKANAEGGTGLVDADDLAIAYVVGYTLKLVADGEDLLTPEQKIQLILSLKTVELLSQDYPEIQSLVRKVEEVLYKFQILEAEKAKVVVLD